MSQSTWWCHTHHLGSWWYRVAILVSAWSSGHAVSSIHLCRHWWYIFVLSIRLSAVGACGSYARCWVQRRSIVLKAVCTTLAGMCILPLHLECCKLAGRLVHRSAAAHRRRAVRFWQLIHHQSVLRQILVVCGAAHVCVLLNALLPGLATNQSPPHSTCYYTGTNDENGSRQYDPAAPL